MTNPAPNPLYSKIIRRIVPYIMLIYMVALLDRVQKLGDGIHQEVKIPGSDTGRKRGHQAHA